MGKRFFTSSKSPDRHPVSCSVGTGFLSQGWSGRDLKRTIHPHLVPRLRMSGGCTLNAPHTPSLRVHRHPIYICCIIRRGSPTSRIEVQCDALSEWNAAENRKQPRSVTSVKSTRVWHTTGLAVREFRSDFRLFPVYCQCVIRKRRMSSDSKLRVRSAKEPTTAPDRLDQRKCYEKGASGIDLTTLRILRRLVKLFPAFVLPEPWTSRNAEDVFQGCQWKGYVSGSARLTGLRTDLCAITNV